MGEELNALIGTIFFKKDDDDWFHAVKLDASPSGAIFINADDDVKDEVYATLSNTDSFNFELKATISRQGYFMLMVGPNKRTVRRAFRWYEKLRRMGYPKENLVVLASYYARKGQRSKKYDYIVAANKSI